MDSTGLAVPDLAVVIVSYNVRDLLRRCLASIDAAIGGLQVEVHVVDNASSDASAATVADEFPAVHLHEPGVNRGYAWSNNLALREVRRRHGAWPRYVLLLNPDTELPPGSLAEMVAFLDARPEAGVAGPRLLKTNGDLALACRRSFPSPEISLYRMAGLSRLFPRSQRFGRYNLTYLDQTDVYEVDSVVGAFMLVRGSLLDDVGLLDETYFMYGEDLDWAFRIKSHGWKVYYNGRVIVYHHKGASSKQRSFRSNRAFYHAMLVFFDKHYAATTSLPIRLLVVAGIYLAAVMALARAALSGAGRGARRSDRRQLASEART